MVIEPREVAPGYARRWARQSFELLGRSFHTMFALSLTVCAIVWALQHAHLGLASPFIMAWFLGAAVEIISISDNHVLRVTDLPDIFRVAAREVVYEVRQISKFILLLLVSAALFAAWYRLQVNDVMPVVAPDLSDPLVWLFSTQSPLEGAAQVLFVAAGIHRYLFLRLEFLRYPLRRTFELDEAAVQLLLEKANRKNSDLSLYSLLFVRVVLFLAMWHVPILTPLLMCVLPALVYVVFREMFIDDRGNREPAKQTSTKLALEGMSQ